MEETKTMDDKCIENLIKQMEKNLEIVFIKRLLLNHDLTILHRKDWDLYGGLGLNLENIYILINPFRHDNKIIHKLYERGDLYNNTVFYYMDKYNMIDRTKHKLSIPYWNALNETLPFASELNSLIFSYIYEKDPYANVIFESELKDVYEFENEYEENEELDEFEEME